MIDFKYLKDVCRETDSKIVMLVVDGLGGAPHPDIGKSELEVARTPNLDSLAQRSACGLTTPVLPGVAPGSGPGHLALFGYDPVKYLMGRGVLEALGIDVDLRDGDVAARGNFCTVDSEGLLTDRRAGRIHSSESGPLCALLDGMQMRGVDSMVYHVKDYRFVLVLRGEGLSEEVIGTDPERTGAAPLPAQALSPAAEKTAHHVNRFVDRAREVLRSRDRANMVLLRGFSKRPQLPSMVEAYRLNPAAIAAYPMYRGLTKLLGMRVIPTGVTFASEVETLRQHYQEHDFFYVHYKPADAAGEDGDFQAKVQALEDVDSYVPEILELGPDVFVVAGDHATPAFLAAHSWHPVPALIHSSLTVGGGIGAFTERQCASGSLGSIQAVDLMFLMLAHAGKLAKFGP